MKKITLLLIPVLTSCTIDDSGEFDFTLLWIFLGIFVVAMILIARSTNKTEKETSERLKSEGLKIESFNTCGKYVGGHPNANNDFGPVVFRREGDKLFFFYRESYVSLPEAKFNIPVEKIEEIEIEDASTIEKKVTLGRVLLVGVFALAWRKKKTNELSFVRIKWNDGRFTHETIFSFEGSNAMQLANTSRNLLIKNCY